MLFAISGSQGTGKSTLISALCGQYPSDIPKTSRSILSDWNVTLSQVNNDHQLTIKFQEEILKRKLADEHSFVHSTDVFCTERTFADLFVYALVALGKDNEYSDWLDDYYIRCKAAQDQYSNVFYLTAGHFIPVHDGIRGSNKHYSKMVDLVMHDYTTQLSECLTIVTTPSLDERIKIVSQNVEYTKSIYLYGYNYYTKEQR